MPLDLTDSLVSEWLLWIRKYPKDGGNDEVEKIEGLGTGSAKKFAEVRITEANQLVGMMFIIYDGKHATMNSYLTKVGVAKKADKIAAYAEAQIAKWLEEKDKKKGVEQDTKKEKNTAKKKKEVPKEETEEEDEEKAKPSDTKKEKNTAKKKKEVSKEETEEEDEEKEEKTPKKKQPINLHLHKHIHKDITPKSSKKNPS